MVDLEVTDKIAMGNQAFGDGICQVFRGISSFATKPLEIHGTKS